MCISGYLPYRLLTQVRHLAKSARSRLLVTLYLPITSDRPEPAVGARATLLSNDLQPSTRAPERIV